MTIQAVLCDVDDVIRFYDRSAIADTEQEHGVPMGTLKRAMFTHELVHSAVTGKITHTEWMARTAATLRDQGLAAEAASALIRALRNITFSIDAQVMGWLDEARTRMPVWLLTNQADNFAETMAGTGVLERVDGVINSAEVGVAKPDLEIYRIAAERVGVAPETCVFIDDRPENTEAAAELGMATILYRSFTDLDGALLVRDSSSGE